MIAVMPDCGILGQWEFHPETLLIYALLASGIMLAFGLIAKLVQKIRGG